MMVSSGFLFLEIENASDGLARAAAARRPVVFKNFRLCICYFLMV
jgi:hypothetical protein